MASCDYCGKEIDFTHICKDCGGRFCTEHKSKSAHDCSGLDNNEGQERHISFSRNRISLGREREKGLTLRDNDRELSHREDNVVEHHSHRAEPVRAEEQHHSESRSKWSRQRPNWQYSGPGGANLKIVARFAVLAFIVILMSASGPFHNDAIATAGHTMWDGIVNMTHSLPDNNSINVTINSP